jgi:S-(hydroxymethyl)glutathione dehydrogenase / alcohol dehydrogenase
MRAACLLPHRDEVVVCDVAATEPMLGEVVVRTSMVGLCHSDYHLVDGSLQRPRPIILGHEAVGVVEQVGAGVQRVRPGDRVVTCLVTGCGACDRCINGEQHLCARPSATRRAAGDTARFTVSLDGRDHAPVGQMGNIGALVDTMVVHERAVVPIPDDIPDRLAAILGCAVVTGLGAVFNVAKVQRGETVAVIGCGGIGLMIVQAARIAGASEIVAVDVHRSKLDMAVRLGATSTRLVDETGDEPGVLVDHAFEAVGRPAAVAMALSLTAPGRTTYVVGVLPDGSSVEVSAADLRAAKSVVGVFMGSTDPLVDIPKAVELWRAGQLDLDAMVSDIVSLDAVNEGFAALASGQVARTVVDLRRVAE